MSVASQVQPHPEALGLGAALVMVLVADQPSATNPIVHGAPDLGWSGDPRMAMYYWPRRQRYVLVRLEADGEYRIVCELPANDKPLSPAAVNKLIRKLIAIDTQRGYDPHTAVVLHNERLEADRQKAHDEWVDEEIAPKLAWAYKRGAGAHLGGSRWDYVVPDTPWKKTEGETTAAAVSDMAGERDDAAEGG